MKCIALLLVRSKKSKKCLSEFGKNVFKVFDRLKMIFFFEGMLDFNLFGIPYVRKYFYNYAN